MSEEFALVTFNIYTILILVEGFLFCLLGRELKKIKELKVNAILIILGITYIILGVFSFRLFARLLTILATIVLFYFIGKLFLRGEEETAGSNNFGKFFKRMLYVAGFFFVLVLIISVIDYYSSRNQNIKEITYSNLLQEVDQGAIERVSITDKYLRGKLKNGQEFSVILPQDASPLIETMHKRNIAISFNEPPAPPWWKALWER